ncbi:MAG: hypothetical protein PHR87_06120 [Sulfurospirillaceae bacterium]|nr:hypothetical protein [Sulfurospirillaceae bacterium]
MYKSKVLLFVSVGIVFLIVTQWIYFKSYSSLNADTGVQKNTFVSLVGLPDLALVTEAHYVRHRSLSDVFTFFSDSPELLEYFPSTFVYTYAPNIKNTPSRMMREE